MAEYPITSTGGLGTLAGTVTTTATARNVIFFNGSGSTVRVQPLVANTANGDLLVLQPLEARIVTLTANGAVTLTGATTHGTSASTFETGDDIPVDKIWFAVI